MYTFKTCCRCHHISKNSINGLKFLCKACGFELNADLNDARNIEHRTRDYKIYLRVSWVSVNHRTDNMFD